MSTATAILFPGQGSQRDGMGDDVRAIAPELHELVVEEVGADPFPRVAEGTRFAQPAILCAALAAWIGAGRPPADAFAGHSLGELGAAAAAGAITLEDAVRLAVQRGRLMGEAAEQEPGGMLALLCPVGVAAELAQASGTTVANDNAPTQVVLSGPLLAIAEAARVAKARQVRTIHLPVGGAFHSEAMRPALEPFRELLGKAAVQVPSAAFVSSTTARQAATPDEVRDALARAIVEPVRWRETVEELHGRGCEEFVETGPGKALTGMVRRTLDGVAVSTLSSREHLTGAANA